MFKKHLGYFLYLLFLLFKKINGGETMVFFRDKEVEGRGNKNLRA